MKTLYIISFLACALNIQAQEITLPVPKDAIKKHKKIVSKDNNTIYNTAGLEEQAQYPGGIKAFNNFIISKIEKTEIKGNEEKLTVYISFVIEKNGSLSNIKILRDPGYNIGTEVQNAIKLSPKWIPGLIAETPVRSSFSMPVIIDFK